MESVSLLFDKEAETDTSNFRRGDIVVLYRYPKGTEPQACRQTVVRATIKLITTTGVELALRNRKQRSRLHLRRQAAKFKPSIPFIFQFIIYRHQLRTVLTIKRIFTLNNPDMETVLCVSHPEASSTCELVFRVPLWLCASIFA